MMSIARKVDAPDMRSEASGANNNLCGVTSMSSVNQFQSKSNLDACLYRNVVRFNM